MTFGWVVYPYTFQQRPSPQPNTYQQGPNLVAVGGGITIVIVVNQVRAPYSLSFFLNPSRRLSGFSILAPVRSATRRRVVIRFVRGKKYPFVHYCCEIPYWLGYGVPGASFSYMFSCFL